MLKFCQTKLKVVVKLLDVKSNKHTVKLSAVRQSNEVGCMIIQCCIHMRQEALLQSCKVSWQIEICHMFSHADHLSFDF